ncbi:reverse transcriptase [Phytophthora megakarya]|uniref:Reverse transcriptase n=1 Tax=Phytophthora megakarya TaxID=4795 RepID=A0A225WFY2_9STRA|nr:reverse transcriptase [Phytophthora megakarya]
MIMMNVYTTMKEDIYTRRLLPEVPVMTDDVKIEDIPLCGSDNQTPEEIDRLPQRIWKFRHILIGKGKALPPAARGARPNALKSRKLRIQFREKLADLIKGLLSAKMINYSRSPWASPIVVIIKKHGVGIRLSIDYRLVNSLTQLIIYPMPLINYLLENLELTLWYCSLDMASALKTMQFMRQFCMNCEKLTLLRWWKRLLKRGSDKDRGPQEEQEGDHRKTMDLEAQGPTELDPRWIHAHRLFSALKAKIATTPILRHFDPDRRATVMVYASNWAISGSLLQEHIQSYYP